MAASRAAGVRAETSRSCQGRERPAAGAAGASSRMTWALVPPMPKELTAARRGSSPAGHGVNALATWKGPAREVDLGVRRLEVQAGRNLSVPQGLDRLDQTGDAGRGVEMAEVGLHRAQDAGARPLAAEAEGAVEGRHLDGIAERRAGAVGLDIADRPGLDVGRRQRLGDHGDLALDAGSREAHLRRAVVVDRRAADHRQDVVAVLAGVGEALEHHDTGAAAGHRAAGVAVEGAAMAVRRVDAALLVAVAGLLRHADGDAAGEHHVALVVLEALAGEMDGHQRGRAGGLHADARPLQV